MTEQKLAELRSAALRNVGNLQLTGEPWGIDIDPDDVLQLLDYVDFLKENPVVPKDWQLVPKHCTVGMESVGGPFSIDQWRAMLEAQPDPLAAPQAQPADALDAETPYQRGYRHGYNQRDAEVQGALL